MPPRARKPSAEPKLYRVIREITYPGSSGAEKRTGPGKVIPLPAAVARKFLRDGLIEEA